MDDNGKNKLLEKLQPEYRGTNIERIYLALEEEGFVPGWLSAAKPIEQIATERAELLAEESRKRKSVEKKLSEVLSGRREAV
ncbi:MAG: hypothetical protein LBT52_05725 [Clostridiales Family XIII bacterium]|jgi:hypothetical protein|nr:hypothetical protein [Clostridiales Family XIII bacterium]